ncbi:TetR family transcriptional regulator [Litoreibacter ponti]|uniref:TetR family transcriptional regulator n=1 Tax=Litoreibacter ponti TaxID=1510457 RepID=A0A2T6BKZ5_9RHOB|nr:TetR/AcrR family transcriptional regulator [Litoreibacter ponti]PTX56740.1 TetR family transcriptional regulator [Litoreibacter ponti]
MIATQKPRGRPRGFDKEAGVETAQALFAAHGYDGVGVAELCSELGVKPPSLYAAYGSKRALFDQVVARYSAASAEVFAPLIAAATSPSDLRKKILEAAIELYDSTGHGCLILSNLTSTEDTDLRAEMAAKIEERRRAMAERLLELGLTEQDARDHVMAISIAMMGLSAAARSGIQRETLLRSLDL